MTDTAHPNDMTAEELRELVSAMAWAALDLGQHLSWLNEVMHNNPEPGYVQAQQMAYAITRMPYEPAPEKSNVDIAMYGPDGLQKMNLNLDDLA